MKNILFMHTGSGNHGCEAIVRTTSEILNGPKDVMLWSNTKSEDLKYGVDKCFEDIVISEQIKKGSLSYFEALFKRKILNQSNANLEIFIRDLFKDNIAISVGGDNYCYEWSAKQGIELDKLIRKYSKKSVLWGCSINPEAITKEMEEDLSKFDLITARENITYNTLKKINPNTVRVADSAFLLERIDLPLPDKFVENNTVGINVSPLIMNYGTEGNLILKNYEKMIEFILNETDMNICLIPHVVWEYNNDLDPINYLYDKYEYSNRICIINDCNCMELKGYIARCRFFVGARTHATIAAYSSCVPTLVVGYSVKSKGIALDLYGTYDKYVLPVQNLTNEEELANNFKWMLETEKEHKEILINKIPEYKKLAMKASEYMKELKG